MKEKIILSSILFILALSSVYGACEDIEYKVGYIGKNATGCFDGLQMTLEYQGCEGFCFSGYDDINISTDLENLLFLPETGAVNSPLFIIKDKFNCTEGVPSKMIVELGGKNSCYLVVDLEEEYEKKVAFEKGSDNNGTDLTGEEVNESDDQGQNTDLIDDSNIENNDRKSKSSSGRSSISYLTYEDDELNSSDEFNETDNEDSIKNKLDVVLDDGSGQEEVANNNDAEDNKAIENTDSENMDVNDKRNVVSTESVFSFSGVFDFLLVPLVIVIALIILIIGFIRHLKS